jgi:hypothetical protein
VDIQQHHGDAVPVLAIHPDRLAAVASRPDAEVLSLQAQLHHGPIAAELRQWLQGKPPSRPLFPVKGRKRNAMLHADLKAAGIEPVVDGRVIDLRSLRVSFITYLSLSGVPLVVA